MYANVYTFCDKNIASCIVGVYTNEMQCVPFREQEILFTPPTHWLITKHPALVTSTCTHTIATRTRDPPRRPNLPANFFTPCAGQAISRSWGIKTYWVLSVCRFLQPLRPTTTSRSRVSPYLSHDDTHVALSHLREKPTQPPSHVLILLCRRLLVRSLSVCVRMCVCVIQPR